MTGDAFILRMRESAVIPVVLPVLPVLVGSRNEHIDRLRKGATGCSAGGMTTTVRAHSIGNSNATAHGTHFNSSTGTEAALVCMCAPHLPGAYSTHRKSSARRRTSFSHTSLFRSTRIIATPEDDAASPSSTCDTRETSSQPIPEGTLNSYVSS